MHQGDRNAAIGRHVGIVRKKRIGIGFARDFVNFAGRISLLLQDLSYRIGAVD